MCYNTREEFLSYIKFMKELGAIKEIGRGSQGVCYYNLLSNKVYKIFHQFFDEDEEFFEYFHTYTKEELLKFSNIDNDTFIWAKDVIVVNNEIIGYISDYVCGKPLYKINPLTVDLNKFTHSVNNVEKDLRIISEHRVMAFDMIYNILYGSSGINIIDHDDYDFLDLDTEKIYNTNSDVFNLGIMYFLIEGYFDEFISNYKDLKEAYKKEGININEFILLFRKYLSEYVGHEIVKLGEANKCLNKCKNRKIQYQRILFDY